MAAHLSIALALFFCTASAAAQAPNDAVAPPAAPLTDLDETDEEADDEVEPPQSPVPGAPTKEEPGTLLPPKPLPHATAKNDEISLEDWNRDDWLLVKPKVSLIDIDGYLRVRGDLYRRLDFDNGSKWELNGQNGDLVSRYPALADGHAEYSDTNMRLRIEPRINITEQAQIISTIDVFDNLLFGSTPRPLIFGNTLTPVGILSRGQTPLRRGQNTLIDSIVVKRLWGRVSALNEQLELRFGRMPNHWGLGMMLNNGDCLDCDWGVVSDRVEINFRAYNHIFSPMVDWVAKGPQFRPFGANDPRPMDAVPWDDVMQYGVRIVREDHPDDIRDAVTHDRSVINYGVMNAFRMQARDFALPYYNNNQLGFDPAVEPTPQTAVERRDAFLYIGDAYGRFFAGNLELSGEAAVQAGSFKDNIIDFSQGGSATAAPKQTTVLKMGAALEAKYHLRSDSRGLQLGLKLGGASGDSARGFGALNKADTQRGAGDYDLHNFQFSPDYHLDLLLFRRILGTVTDAWYVRPELAYRFDDKVLARVNAVYSQVMRARSTPSAAVGVGNRPMGVEFDGELSYGLDPDLERGQFMTALAAGILWPLGAFNNPQAAKIDQQGGNFAWTVQARLYLTF